MKQLSLVVSMLLASLFSCQSASADVQLGAGSSDVCDIRIVGTITDDDATAFQAFAQQLIDQSSRMYEIAAEFVTQNWPHTVCLNSPGGSYLAGIEIALTLQGFFETRLEPNSNCLSACAIVFMAGSADEPWRLFARPSPEEAEYGFNVQPRRVMSTSSTLGFHAPYVEYGERDMVSAQEAQDAVLGTISLTTFLLEATQENFPLPLAVEAMSRGPDDMFFINEVGQLNAWDITLDAEINLDLTVDRFRTAWITFAHRYANGRGGYGSVGDPAFGASDTMPELFGTSGWNDVAAGQTQSGARYLQASSIGGEASFGAVFLDYGDQFQLRVLSPDFATEYARYDISHWQLLPPRTRIEDLR